MNNEFRMYVGPMFGGKTTRMLSQIERYKYMGLDTMLFKPKIDGRFGVDIVTHSGISQGCTLVNSGFQIENLVNSIMDKNPGIVAVDEVFMIHGAGDALINLFKKGHTILISSLQLSSDGTPYCEVQKLFPYATYVAVCPAVDPISKQDAYYTEKYAGRKDHGIEVGGAEMYRPRDWNGFFGYNG